MLRIREDDIFALYRYTPTLIPPIVTVTLFFSGAIFHAFLVQRLRAKYFIPFVVGCSMEGLGYTGRIWSHYDKEGLPGYIIQSLLILIAPALFAASIYMVLGRIIGLVDGQQHSIIPLKWLTKVFVTGDSISFLAQALGGGIQSAGTLELLHAGEKIIVAGLFVQIFFFGVFVILAVMFHVRIYMSPTRLSCSPSIPWRRHFWALYLTSGIILVRSIFRIIEYMMGNSGWILEHEFMLYVFDTTLMLVVVVVFLVQHPGKLFLDAKRTASEINLSTMGANPDVHGTYEELLPGCGHALAG
ncbi:MAG: hypothetical protein M1834_005928 [Cirrosporium novae-zelandiae]|nr:MAG: hypothetical protein M1834_005928 [Cirrosporium novae-zelandiae]